MSSGRSTPVNGATVPVHPPQQEGSNDNGSNSKRKRDDAEEIKRKKAKTREQEMGEEFAATYHGYTALYKLLEVKHLQSPLFLPRTLGYRVEWRKSRKSKNMKKKNSIKAPRTLRKLFGAKLTDLQILLTSRTKEILRQHAHTLVLRITAYTGKGKHFSTNEFQAIGFCVVPAHGGKEIVLKEDFIQTDSDIYMLCFQLEESETGVSDQNLYEMTSLSASSILTGQALLCKNSSDKKVFLSGVLRLSPKMKRKGSFAVNLQATDQSLFPNMTKCGRLSFTLSWQTPAPQATSKFTNVINQLGKKEDPFLPKPNGPPCNLVIPKRSKGIAWKNNTSSCSIEENENENDQRSNTSVYFHYLYHSMLRRMTEKRPDYSCPWCNLFCGTIRGLLAHLTCSHSYFRFQVTMGHNSIPNIFVTVNPLEPQQSIPSWSAHAIDRIETHYSYISPRRQYWHEAVIQDEFEELDGMTSLSCSSSTSTTTTTTDESTKVYEPSEGRQYFHSRTGAVVLEHEKNYDSDDDVDEEWINELGERLLDEFEDVSLEEKEFMKRWNRYTRANPILADFMVASNCRQFAKQYGKELIECGLRNNFLLHLFNLWDNSLLTNKAVLECMLIADHMASTLPKDE